MSFLLEVLFLLGLCSLSVPGPCELPILTHGHHRSLLSLSWHLRCLGCLLPCPVAAESLPSQEELVPLWDSVHQWSCSCDSLSSRVVQILCTDHVCPW